MDREHKKVFQLERIMFFSDALFAIAITLLVIDLKIPEMETVTNQEIARGLKSIIPNLISFFISFMIIGIYWVSHHRMFYYIINYDRKLLWLNMFLLFFIALMPFSSHIYGVYNNFLIPFIVYTFNLTMLALFHYLMYRYISKPSKNLSEGLENKRLVHYYTLRSWAVPVCFTAGLIITFTAHNNLIMAVGRMVPMLIFPIMKILRRMYSDVITIE
jgi:uncharacterized membrane protein